MPVTTADYSKVDKAHDGRTPWLRMLKHPAVWAIVVRASWLRCPLCCVCVLLVFLHDIERTLWLSQAK
jgi:hypothetical protein